jgi:hypothetical protein
MVRLAALHARRSGQVHHEDKLLVLSLSKDGSTGSWFDGLTMRMSPSS